MAHEQDQLRGSEAAARAVWHGSPAAVAATPGASVVRRALIQAVVGAIAGGVFFVPGHRVLAIVAWSIASVMLLTALLSPDGLHARLTRGIQLLGLGIGKLLTWVLLVPFFFLFFALFGRVMRGGKRDKMERWLERSGATYWKPREADRTALADYERQF